MVNKALVLIGLLAVIVLVGCSKEELPPCVECEACAVCETCPTCETCEVCPEVQECPEVNETICPECENCSEMGYSNLTKVAYCELGCEGVFNNYDVNDTDMEDACDMLCSDL